MSFRSGSNCPQESQTCCDKIIESCDAKPNSYLKVDTCTYEFSKITVIIAVDVSSRHYCKLDEILRNCFFEYKVIFGCC